MKYLNGFVVYSGGIFVAPVSSLFSISFNYYIYVLHFQVNEHIHKSYNHKLSNLFKIIKNVYSREKDKLFANQKLYDK